MAKRNSKLPAKVYMLWHERTDTSWREVVKLIGWYETEEEAAAAQRECVKLPGFREWPDGFEIAGAVVDRLEGSEGLLTDDGGPES